MLPSSKKTPMRYIFVLLIIIGAIFYISSCHIKRDTIRIYSTNVKRAPFDAVIVPGIPYSKENPEYMMPVRLRWAMELYKKGIAKNIIFSGSAVHSPYVEGLYMKIMADSLGVPSSHTFAEEKALHSIENISYGLVLADSLGFHKVAIATDPFQSIFLSSTYSKINPALAFLPLDVDSMKSFSRPLPSVNVNAAFVHNFIPLEKRK